MKLFDRDRIRMFPLQERKNDLDIRLIACDPDRVPEPPAREAEQIKRLAAELAEARNKGKSRMLTYGAHLIKNGCGPIVIRLMEKGWLTHAATNGAGSIHDWEFAWMGKSSENVRENVAQGRFGTWDETGRYINLAVTAGAVEGLGYGESVGRMIADDGITIPSADALSAMIGEGAQGRNTDRAAAAMDLVSVISKYRIPSGFLPVRHACKEYSVQRAAREYRIPFTVHPGIGYDIIYTHPMNCAAAIGRAAGRDFLGFAESVSGLSGGGVSISVGCAVMSPMVFEKSMSIANNRAILEGRGPARDFSVAIVDIQNGGGWDWSAGEPPKDNPAYYLRFCKSFYRMGGRLDYICLDNRLFLASLYKELLQYE
ncbi:MAG: hypothetical protein J5758_01675 [Abditibacteriota bacterium]|nr:hypothetical protein [Abditibacteriota bacterium]